MLDNKPDATDEVSQRTQRRTYNRRLLIALIIFCIFFAMIYTARLGRYADLQTDQALWEQRIERSQEKQAQLLEWRNYVDSEAFVAEKAREELGWSQDGDELILVVDPASEVEAGGEVEVGAAVDAVAPVDAAQEDAADVAPAVDGAEQPAVDGLDAVDAVDVPLLVDDLQTPIWQQWVGLFVQE